MYKLKSAQKDKVKQFVQLTNTNEKTAIFVLSQHEWRLDVACDAFYNNPDMWNRDPRLPPIDRKRLDQWFNRYPRCEADKLGVEGVAMFLDDLRLSAEDRKVLILAWKLNAKQQCEFTRDEFVTGMMDMVVENVDALRAKLIQYEAELREQQQKLRDLYAFTWDYAKSSPTTKTLEAEIAVAYWRIVLDGLFLNLELWIQFVMSQDKPRAISRDTWNLVLEFALTIDPRMSNYDIDGAWPTMIDEFVEWAKKRDFNSSCFNNSAATHNR